MAVDAPETLDSGSANHGLVSIWKPDVDRV
jgi:hypothetical protein